MLELTEVGRAESGQAGEGDGSLFLPIIPQQQIEDVVFGSRTKSPFVHGSSQQLTVVHHHN